MAMSGSNPYAAGFQAAGQQLWSGLPGIAQGLFGDSGAPYRKAGEAYLPYYEKAKEAQNPFYNFGQQAIPQYQDYLTRMKDPSAFINDLMSKYQQSPWARYQQQEAMRAANNAASASGLLGSSPYTQQVQQNASNISSQDMQNWLQNVLGINTSYGAGLNQELGYGQHAGDVLSGLEEGAGSSMARVAAGEKAGEQEDKAALWQGIAKLFGG